LLAEDNVLGQRVRDLGLSVNLADTVPSATVPEPTLRALWQHEMRWTRTIRQLAPRALCASTIQFPLFWSPIAIALSGAASWSIALFAAAWAVRGFATLGIDGALRAKVGRPAGGAPWWLLPVRDILSVAEIGFSFWIDEVIWRGHRMGANGAVTAPVCPLSVEPAPEQL
jgi:ceramide glucosyltransferase